MKVYFIFDIKKEFVNLYKNNEKILFDILRQIYNLDNSEISFGYTLLNQIINKIDKDYIDQKIYIKYHQYIPYSKKNMTHYINNMYRNEISRLSVKHSYIKLEQENKSSMFLDILRNYSNNYFVCDFKNKDFFFLSDKNGAYNNI